MYKDNLQLDILQARADLSPSTKKAIDAVDWRRTINQMNKKYSPEQLKVLEKKTELLLCGLLKTDDYPRELGLEMNIPKENVVSLITEMDVLVFEKIQKELERELEKEDIITERDPLFSNLPENIERAITGSNWKEKTYNIAQKYKLSIEQMGILEELTIKTMRGEIKSNNYKNHLSEKINIPKEILVNLIEDINENVLKNIAGTIRKQSELVYQEELGKKESQVPIPPYKKDEKPVFGNQIPVPSKKNEGGESKEKQDKEIVSQEKPATDNNGNRIDKISIPLPPKQNNNKVLGLNIENKDDQKEVKIITPTSEKTNEPAKTNYQSDPYREKI
jgi:hypothetical protein